MPSRFNYLSLKELYLNIRAIPTPEELIIIEEQKRNIIAKPIHSLLRFKSKNNSSYLNIN